MLSTTSPPEGVTLPAPSDSASGTSMAEVALFIDTDLDTHFVVAVPPDISAGALKSEVERVHFNCFPKIGEIKVHGFMVKEKSNFYNLPDTALVKFALSAKGPWSLHVKAKPSNEFTKSFAPEIGDSIPNLTNSTDLLKRRNHARSTWENRIGKKFTRKRLRRKECLPRLLCRSVLHWSIKRKKKKTSKTKPLKYTEEKLDIEDHTTNAENGNGSTIQRFFHSTPSYDSETSEQRYASSLVEAATELSSEVMSVSSIINRYFPMFDEVSSVTNHSSCAVTSRSTQNMVYNFSSPQFSTKKASNFLPFPLTSNTSPQSSARPRPKLGTRLVMASYKLGISPSNERPEISLCNPKGINLFSSSVKSSCFEISDSED